MNPIRVGILGGTSYTGLELLRLLCRHPAVAIEFVTSETLTGRKLTETFPEFRNRIEIGLQSLQEVENAKADVVFSCLPHGESMRVVPKFLSAGTKIIDLSADFRLKSAEDYQKWYGCKHLEPALLAKAVYGLPEIYRDRIRNADLVANPGCYPTGILLALFPLLDKGLLQGPEIIVDSKSGISGAGRKPSEKTHFVERNENVAAYSIGRAHRHIAEIEQVLKEMSSRACTVIFSPHLIPMNRGILNTVYLSLNRRSTGAKKVPNREELIQVYRGRYHGERFVRILDQGLPETRFILGSNYCDIGLHILEEERRVIVVSALDNLVKGASGQAIQNMNLLFGLEEGLGLN